MSTTLRVSDETRDRVASLAEATGEQRQVIVEKAVRLYEETLFWEGFERGYQRLAADPSSWADVQAERTGEAGALRDGLASE